MSSKLFVFKITASTPPPPEKRQLLGYRTDFEHFSSFWALFFKGGIKLNFTDKNFYGRLDFPDSEANYHGISDNLCNGHV